MKETYTDHELDRLVERLTRSDYTEHRDWVIVNILLGTGIRSKTLCSLRICNVGLKEDELRCNTTKNRITKLFTYKQIIKENIDRVSIIKTITNRGRYIKMPISFDI